MLDLQVLSLTCGERGNPIDEDARAVLDRLLGCEGILLTRDGVHRGPGNKRRPPQAVVEADEADKLRRISPKSDKSRQEAEYCIAVKELCARGKGHERTEDDAEIIALAGLHSFNGIFVVVDEHILAKSKELQELTPPVHAMRPAEFLAWLDMHPS